MTIIKFKPSIDASGKKYRIIPTIEVYSRDNEQLTHKEALHSFSEEFCRETLLKHYNINLKSPLQGAVEVKEDQFYLFKAHISFEPSFGKDEVFLSFDNVEFLG